MNATGTVETIAKSYRFSGPFPATWIIPLCFAMGIAALRARHGFGPRPTHLSPRYFYCFDHSHRLR
jgi:hypothetical protein